MKHVIRKQVLDLVVDKDLDAFLIQQELHALYWNEIVPLLEKVFDEIGNGDEMVSVRHLEVSLGNLAPSDLRQRWQIDKLLAHLATQLFDQLRHQEGIREGNIRRNFITRSVFAQWLFYMEKGFLSWNSHTPDEGWYEKVLEALATDYRSVEQLLDLLKRNEKALERIIVQHPVTFLIHVATLLTAKDQKMLSAIIFEMADAIICIQERAGKGTYDSRTIESAIWRKVFRIFAFQPAAHRSAQDILQFLVLHGFSIKEREAIVLFPAAATRFPLVVAGINNLLHDHRIPADNNQVNDGKHGRQDAEGAGAEDRHSDETGAAPGVELPSELHRTLNDDMALLNSSGDKKEDKPQLLKDSDVEEGIFISYAGIVLIHPFLQALFTNLQWVSNGLFISAGTQKMAVCLLHHLASGNREPEEHEMVISKLLCGYALQDPMDRYLKLDEHAYEEGEQMLVELIAQWQILKNTSPEGLRDGFLRRAGKLYKKNDHFSIQPETSSIDMLLDYLPWQLSFVKLPWMKSRLTIEWR